jgi:hypothetical protein
VTVIGPAVALALALSWAAPALAQVTFDPIEVQRERMLRAKPHLPDNAALTAAATTLYPTGLWRDDHTAGRGAPPLFFQPQTGTCAANSMVNDGGACTDGADSNSWRAVHPADGLDIRQFGAESGASSSLAAMQAAVNESRRLALASSAVPASNRAGPPVILPKGHWKIDGTWDVYPGSGATALDLKIVWKTGAAVLIAFHGDPAQVAIKGTDATPANRGGALTLEDAYVAFDSSVPTAAVGPVMFEKRYASGLRFTGIGYWINYHYNTTFRITGCWNCNFGYTFAWGGGVTWPYKTTASDDIFSITSDSTTLTTNNPVFAAGDVGKKISLYTNQGQQFEIASFTNDQSVEVTKTALVTWSSRGSFESAKGSITSGSATLNLNANVASATDIGRQVWVLGAGTPPSGAAKGLLQATITAVPAANQVTLSTTAAAEVTDAIVAVSPGIEMYDEAAGHATNDTYWLGLQSELFRGTGLLVNGGNNIRFDMMKLHNRNNQYNDEATQLTALLTGANDIRISQAGFDGASIEAFKIYSSGLWGTVSLFQSASAGLLEDQVAYYKDSSAVAGSVRISDWTLWNNYTRTIDNMFVNVLDGDLVVDGVIASNQYSRRNADNIGSVVYGSALEAGSNLRIGLDALPITQTGLNNAAFGVSAAASNTTGSNFVAVGQNAGRFSTTGTGWTALGQGALLNQTTATSNLGVGGSAGRNVSTGGFQTFVGTFSGLGLAGSEITGIGNTGVGYRSLTALTTTATSNTALGVDSGLAITTGQRNLLLGPHVGSTTLTTGSRNILLGTTSNCATDAASTNDQFKICASSGTTPLMVGNLNTASLALTINGTTRIVPPTSCTGLATGTLYNNAGTPAFCP